MPITTEDRRHVLDNRQLQRILSAHYISTMQVDGKLFALEEWTEGGNPVAQWIDCTGWTVQEARDWLGY